MTINEIKVKNFIIEVDVNKYDKYDIYVWDDKDHFLYSVPNIELINLNSHLEELEEWLINGEHIHINLQDYFKKLISRVEINCNTLFNNNKAFEFDDKLIEYDEDLRVINVYQGGNKLFSLEG